MIRATTVILLLFGLALSGCLGSGDEGAAPQGSEDPAPGNGTSPAEPTEPLDPTATPSQEPEPTTNTPPAVVFSASITSGVLPLNVTFNITATDDDGNELSWSLDADGDGTPDLSGPGGQSPVATYFVYTKEGKFNATASVTDGLDVTNQTVLIDVKKPVVLSGATTLPGPPLGRDLGAQGCVGFDAGQNGRDCYFFTLLATYAGRPFEATTTSSNADIVFWDTCSATSGKQVQAFTTSAAKETGKVPNGAGCAIMWTFSTGTGTMTLTIS